MFRIILYCSGGEIFGMEEKIERTRPAPSTKSLKEKRQKM